MDNIRRTNVQVGVHKGVLSNRECSSGGLKEGVDLVLAGKKILDNIRRTNVQVVGSTLTVLCG